MSANELRQAAETLRLRAEAATPGPWEFHVSEFTDLGGDVSGITDNGCSCDYNCNRTDPAYIATIHPGVGLAVADLLDREADEWDVSGGCESAYGESVRLALLINGDAT